MGDHISQIMSRWKGRNNTVQKKQGSSGLYDNTLAGDLARCRVLNIYGVDRVHQFGANGGRDTLSLGSRKKLLSCREV